MEAVSSDWPQETQVTGSHKGSLAYSIICLCVISADFGEFHHSTMSRYRGILMVRCSWVKLANRVKSRSCFPRHLPEVHEAGCSTACSWDLIISKQRGLRSGKIVFKSVKSRIEYTASDVICLLHIALIKIRKQNQWTKEDVNILSSASNKKKMKAGSTLINS